MLERPSTWFSSARGYGLESKMKLDDFGVSLGMCAQTSELQLMRDADKAWHEGDRPRCVDAISRLYDYFDEEGFA